MKMIFMVLSVLSVSLSTPALAGTGSWIYAKVFGSEEEIAEIEKQDRIKEARSWLVFLVNDAKQFHKDLEMYEVTESSKTRLSLISYFKEIVRETEVVLSKEGAKDIKEEINGVLTAIGLDLVRFAKVGVGPEPDERARMYEDTYAVATYKFKKIYEDQLQVDQAPFRVFNSRKRIFVGNPSAN